MLVLQDPRSFQYFVSNNKYFFWIFILIITKCSVERILIVCQTPYIRHLTSGSPWGTLSHCEVQHHMKKHKLWTQTYLWSAFVLYLWFLMHLKITQRNLFLFSPQQNIWKRICIWVLGLHLCATLPSGSGEIYLEGRVGSNGERETTSRIYRELVTRSQRREQWTNNVLKGMFIVLRRKEGHKLKPWAMRFPGLGEKGKGKG